MATQGVLYEIHVECQKDGFDIINEFDGSSYDEYCIYNCDASWSSDEFCVVRIFASVPDDWDEGDADDAMEDLLDDLGLDYEYFDTCLE